MDHDFRYECALAAALVIMDFFDTAPGAPKHELLATAIFSILHAMDRYDEQRSERHVRFSTN
jgi:hypothetical protein